MSDHLFGPPRPSIRDGVYGLDEVAGRYRYPAPPGEALNPRGWMRMTNLVSAFSDQERLQLWLEWKTLEGLRADDGLIVDEWLAERVDHLDADARKALANAYAERARDAARADEGARRGTARHLMLSHYFESGVVTGTRQMRAQLAAVVKKLDEADLEILATEFKVWHPAAGGTMGTADARVLCRRTGQIGVLDWKTQLRFWTWQEIAGQMFGYDSAPWWWNEDIQGWDAATPYTLVGAPGGGQESSLEGKRVAIVAHVPRDRAEVDLYEVDLEYGRNVLQTAARSVELRSIGRSTALNRRPARVRS